MMRLLAAMLAMTVAVPVAAQEAVPADLAESRLRGCLLAGSSAAPQTALGEAVISVRTFCAPQIARVRHMRVAAATRGRSAQDSIDAENAATLALNDEIVRAVANFTGLTQ